MLRASAEPADLRDAESRNGGASSPRLNDRSFDSAPPLATLLDRIFLVASA